MSDDGGVAPGECSGPVPVVEARQLVTADRRIIWMADGPDGHSSLLSRGSKEQAERDGLEYFLRTRERRGGEWVIRRST